LTSRTCSGKHWLTYLYRDCGILECMDQKHQPYHHSCMPLIHVLASESRSK